MNQLDKQKDIQFYPRCQKKEFRMQNSTNVILPQRQDIFEIVREIPLEDIIRRYAQTEIRHRAGKLWLLCPFHADKNPSLSLKGNRWKCFGCGVGGDGVDFVAKLYNLPTLEAARMIARDFGLAEGLDKPLTPPQRAEIQHRQQMRKIEQVFVKTVDEAYLALCDVRIKTCRIIDASGEDGLTFSHLPNVIDQYLDALQFGNDAEKMEILRSEVAKRWTKLLPKTS